MRLRQLELQNKTGRTRVYWVAEDYTNQEQFEVGQQILLREEIEPLKISQVLTTCTTELRYWLESKLKARMATIFA